MNNRGFTLVELLAVIVIIAVITGIGSAGIYYIHKSIDDNIWSSTVDMIENRAALYGEDHKNALSKSTSTCQIGDTVKEHCIETTIGTLIAKGYISTKETIKDGEEIKKVLKDNRTDEIINDQVVYIYLENNMVYAKYIEKQ